MLVASKDNFVEKYVDNLEFNNLSFVTNSESSNAGESSPAKKINDILSSNGYNRFDLRELIKVKEPDWLLVITNQALSF